MAGLRKFLGGVVSGGLVAGLTLVVASQMSAPPGRAVGNAPGADQGGEAAAVPVAEAAGAAVETEVTEAGADVADEVVAGVTAAETEVAGAEAADTDGAVVDAGEAAEAAGPAVAAVSEAPGDGSALAPVDAGGTTEAPAAAMAEPVANAAESGAAAAQPDVAADAGAVAEATAEAGASDAASATEAAPVAAALPDAPPAVPATDAPAQSVPVAQDAAPKPAAEVAVAVGAEAPAAPVTPAADGAPDGAELPPPPPLTAAEEAMLQDLARLEVPVEEAAVEQAPVEQAPVEQAQPDAAPAAEAAAAPEGVAEVAPEPIPVAEPAADAAPAVVASPVLPAPEPAPVPTPVPTTTPEAAPASEPSVLAVDGAQERLVPDAGLGADGPSTLPPAPRLITAGEGSLTDRGNDAPAADEAASAATESGLPEVALEDAPALQRFAAAFANADGKPLFGLVLVDSGEAALDRQAVASLPFPVTIAVDPLSPDAAAHAALYRAGGKEVMMLATGIPEGATPADVEQTFQAHAATLPEAVGVIDAADAAFQNNRPLSTQIVEIIAAQGRGLLTWDRGLNAADQVARREGLPSAVIFRQIDAEGESVPVMRRYLDRAAFKAAQDGEVVVMGTLRSETIAAILEWTIEGRASSVALAPASAILTTP